MLCWHIPIREYKQDSGILLLTAKGKLLSADFPIQVVILISGRDMKQLKKLCIWQLTLRHENMVINNLKLFTKTQD